MEHRKAPTTTIAMVDVSNNNNSYHHNQRKKRTAKRQTLPSPSLTSKYQHVPSVIITDPNSKSHKIYVRESQEQQDEHIPMKNPLGWTKRWTKWFSSCGTERISQTDSNSPKPSRRKRARTKSENDVSKRGSIEQDEKKKVPPTSNSSFAIGQDSNEFPEENLSRRPSHQHHHLHLHQSNDRVNNSNSVVYRDRTRRYSNSFFTSARYGGPRTSIAAIPLTTTIITTPPPPPPQQHTSQQKQPSHLSRSVDRLHNKSNRRELRYEEHDDYIPTSPLDSIQCHPTIDHYTKSLNQSTYFSSNHRRSQIEAYQLSSINNNNNRLILPRPYSSNIPHSYTIQIMSKASSDNNTYGKLSECHSPLTPLENSSIKTPRRIESNYGQFPIQQEPVYANTQSLYDNILYPQSTSKFLNRTTEQEKRSCASQTQLTWTMATFSSFVDLENQSVIIPQPDPNTLYSIVQHHQLQPSPSASSETVEQMRRTSPQLQYDDTNPSSHYQRPRSPIPTSLIPIEKRDGSFQTILSIAPTEDLQSNKQLFIHDSTPSPVSTGSSAITGQQQQRHHHHHHHHHRKHKSRHNTSNPNISTRDVGLQVNIQTVKKITILSQKSGDESSLTTTATTTTPSSPQTMKTSRELKNVETNTEPLINKCDISTSYEANIHLATSSSQTTDSSPTSSLTTSFNRQTKAAQTPNRALRNQTTETNNVGLFVCDLSSLLENGSDEPTSLTTKRKS